MAYSVALCRDAKQSQENILHIFTYADAIDAARLPYVFTNGHATMQPLEIFDSLSDIDKVDWEILQETPTIEGYAKYWHDNHNNPQKPKWTDRKRRRQAGFLVYQEVSWQLIQGIGTMTETKATEVRTILSRYGYATPVLTKAGWYFLIWRYTTFFFFFVEKKRCCLTYG